MDVYLNIKDTLFILNEIVCFIFYVYFYTDVR